MPTPKTPLMKQYDEMKSKHPDAVLLFRVGDFYETFREDAITASQILGITLTRRAMPSGAIELAGFPHHALDTYLPKLVRAGKRVAICEQLEDPKLSKKTVKRGISEVITPNKQMAKRIDLTAFLSLLSAILEIVKQLYTLDEIMRKSRELKALLRPLGLSNKEIFNIFVAEQYYQPSLFD